MLRRTLGEWNPSELAVQADFPPFEADSSVSDFHL